MDKERFSLLLLEPGEIYFEDFSAFLFPIDANEDSFERTKQIGRLKMCSKSVVFDPKDVTKPLVKIPLKECTGIAEWREELTKRLSPGNNVIAVDCKQYVEMLAGNVLAPYLFVVSKHKFLFLLNYARITDCLPQLCQLHRASTLPAAEQSSMIAAIVHSRQSRVNFDTLWLEDLYEKVVLETQGNKITPLVVNPGRILLTSSRLYFQPYNNVESYPVLKIRLQDIKRIIQRRFLLRQVGIEIYCENSSQVSHLYLSFKSKAERDALFDGLLSQPSVRLENTEQEMMTLKWQNGALSNYEYLLYLNSMADRTFNDLTQYPVFPWVIQDYMSSLLDLDDPKSYRDLTKPVGALNKVRLDRLKERCEEMSPPKFLFGSHYSAPGFVLFYLVRKYPHYMLCLQNGRFDHPDRMFNSVPDVWKNVMTNMSDFKEVIPAFYDIQSGGDFLVNTYGIHFGYKHDGTKVGDVQLPRWAIGPLDFVRKLRDALESSHVSKMLHNWIDLIFGYKQVGKEAEKADNLFYYLCYEGAIDLDSVHDVNQRHALEVQIMEFGQIPKQIFSIPHPQRITGIPPMVTTDLQDNTSIASSIPECGSIVHEHMHNVPCTTVWHNFSTLRNSASFQSHKEQVTDVAISENKQFVVSVGQDSLLKIYSLSEKRQVRSVTLSSMALSSCVIMPDDKFLIVGSWDNNIILYDIEFGREIDSVRGHEDAVSCLTWGNMDQVLVSGSWDCSVRIWQGLADMRRIKPSSSLAAEFDHDAHITCLSLSRSNKLLVTGTKDGDLFLWCMDTQSLSQKLPKHNDTVTAASFSPDDKKLVSCGEDRTFKVFDLNSGMQVYMKTLDEKLRCLCWDGFTLILGGNHGSLYIWDLVQVKLLRQLPAHTGAVTKITASNDGSLLVSSGEDRRVIIWESSSDN